MGKLLPEFVFVLTLIFETVCGVSEIDFVELKNSKDAFIPASAFPTVPNIGLASMSLAEYVPISSRDSYRGEYKVWPKTFETFLNRMPLVSWKVVKFVLHTRTSPPQGELLNKWFSHGAANSSWDSSAKTKILIHGYLQTARTPNMPQQLLEAYRSMNSTANFLLVDWGRLAAQEYFEAAMYSQAVGRTLAECLVVLKNRGFLKSFLIVHLIGAGLGAQVAAATASHLKTRLGPTAILGRITGLDPAGPGFHSRTELRLDPYDADFVDVIHTNGGLGFRHGEFGVAEAVGLADFYPNGGARQPISACNHLKAADYYKRSIAEEIFRACRCSSWSAFDTEYCPCTSGPYMGEHLQRTAGKFYLHVFEYTLFEMFENEGFV